MAPYVLLNQQMAAPQTNDTPVVHQDLSPKEEKKESPHSGGPRPRDS